MPFVLPCRLPSASRTFSRFLRERDFFIANVEVDAAIQGCREQKLCHNAFRAGNRFFVLSEYRNRFSAHVHSSWWCCLTQMTHRWRSSRCRRMSLKNKNVSQGEVVVSKQVSRRNKCVSTIKMLLAEACCGENAGCEHAICPRHDSHYPFSPDHSPGMHMTK